MSLEEKCLILERVKDGTSVSEIAKSLHVNRSTIASIVKMKDTILLHKNSSKVVKKAKKLVKRKSLFVEMESLLKDWLCDQNSKNIPISTLTLQRKASVIYDKLTTQYGAPSNESNKFVASKGWFNRFRMRENLRNIKFQGEKASCDVGAAQKFIRQLDEFIIKHKYEKEQIFNVDETALFWKRVPDRTFLASLQSTDAGLKTIKERLTLLFGGNSSGDCKLKPMLIHRAQNPRA